jgi:hypothetical protein
MKSKRQYSAPEIIELNREQVALLLLARPGIVMIRLRNFWRKCADVLFPPPKES